MMGKGKTVRGLLLTLLCAALSESESTAECDPDYDFSCIDGNGCIPLNNRCNGDFNCVDKSDESEEICKDNCAGIEDRFACANGQCLNGVNKACNGAAECDDGSDEDEKLCSDCNGDTDRWKCKGSSECINQLYRCDSFLDCGEDDPSDEDPSLCGDNCGGIEGRFKCGNNKCLDESQVCDGYIQCDTDESDEICANCNGNVDKTKCALSTRCFREIDKCDEFKDCNIHNEDGSLVTEDNTDEENCSSKHESSESVLPPVLDESANDAPTPEE